VAEVLEGVVAPPAAAAARRAVRCRRRAGVERVHRSLSGCLHKGGWDRTEGGACRRTGGDCLASARTQRAREREPRDSRTRHDTTIWNGCRDFSWIRKCWGWRRVYMARCGGGWAPEASLIGWLLHAAII
jgi:hypothetical protein